MISDGGWRLVGPILFAALRDVVTNNNLALGTLALVMVGVGDDLGVIPVRKIEAIHLPKEN
jgi:hypothetical protein